MIFIVPWFKTELDINLEVAEKLDTDQFGIFSGEIERYIVLKKQSG